MILLIISLFAYADDNNPENRNIRYKEKTEIDFEALELEGELIKPQGALLLERKKATFNPLIRLRTNWSQEMSESTTLIQ